MAQSGATVPHSRAAAVTGNGGGGGRTQNDPTTDLAPWRPTPSDPFDRRKAAHLIRRAGFGGSLDEIDAVVTLGVDRVIDLFLTPSTQGLREYGIEVLSNGEILNLTYSVPAKRAQWLHECVHTLYPLREKMALFWHDHFSVGADSQQSAAVLTKHINVFRSYGLRNFRQLLIAVTADPAMLYWLDNYLNGNRGLINENYGRELLELYSLGINGGYTETDVQQASRCLTGWTLNGVDRFAYNPNTHIGGVKVVLGQTIDNGANGIRDVYKLIDVILGYRVGGVPRAARYVATKIWEYFVSPDHYPALIDELALRWEALDYDIRGLMSIILRSNAFFAATAWRRLVKSPVEFAVGALRGTVTPISRYVQLGNRVEAMGLPLLAYSNPSGLEEGVAWIDSSTVIARANLANEMTMVNSSANVQIGAAFDPFREIARHNLGTVDAVVDHYLAMLVDGDVPAQVRSNLLDFMNKSDSGPDPFQFTVAKINEKVRGLVHLILSLPEYQMA